MLAAKNDHIKEAAETIFQLSADEQIRERCLAREEYYREIRTYKKIIAEKDSALLEKDSIIQKLSAELAELRTEAGK